MKPRSDTGRFLPAKRNGLLAQYTPAGADTLALFG
jgi:hypothetical protein